MFCVKQGMILWKQFECTRPYRKIRVLKGLTDEKKEKEFIDEIRKRNGNLEITVSKQAQNMAEL